MGPIFLFLVISAVASAENWPQWRGPRLDGISGEANLPVKWSATDNVAWKLPLPSLSGSTPIIWGQKVFLHVADGDNLQLWCVDRKQGNVLWKRPTSTGNHKYRKGNSSNNSPVTDGTTIWVINGNGVLKSFDFDGKELWARDLQKDYGRFGHNHGYSNSPLLYEDALYVEVLHGMHTKDPSYVLRIDKKTGRTVWRVERPTQAIHESPDSYTTPALLTAGGKKELVITGGDVITGHDLSTGKELWRGTGFNPQNDPAYRVVASPVVFQDVVYAPTRVRPLLVYRGGGRGDVTQTHRLWSFENGPDVPTPVVDGKYFYTVNDRGIVWVLDARTGQEIYGAQRLKPATYSSSPVLADAKIYITNEDGMTSVIRTGPKFEVLAENMLDDYTLSSPAISDGQIFLRTTQFLYCIGKK